MSLQKQYENSMKIDCTKHKRCKNKNNDKLAKKNIIEREREREREREKQFQTEVKTNRITETVTDVVITVYFGDLS